MQDYSLGCFTVHRQRAMSIITTKAILAVTSKQQVGETHLQMYRQS